VCSPGGFLATALKMNPGVRAMGLSLPASKGGHNMLLLRDPNVALEFLDGTMAAGDMGVIKSQKTIPKPSIYYRNSSTLDNSSI
jgi:hypothetical protein